MTNKTRLKAKTSQELIPIQEIRDGVVILKNGSLRMVLMASSLNFALKSAEEQEAIIAQNQNFLNSLDFSIQYFIQSRKLNINPYLDSLRKRAKETINELLKMQINEYIDFINNLVNSIDIVKKNFFVVIPFTPAGLTAASKGLSGILNKILPVKKGVEVMAEEKFKEYKIQLQQRVDTVIGGLSRMGIKTKPLNTEELIELYYVLYNPEETDKAKIPPYQPAKNQSQSL
jgi:hypothetical protein